MDDTSSTLARITKYGTAARPLAFLASRQGQHGMCVVACPPGPTCAALVPYYKSMAAWTVGESMLRYICVEVFGTKLYLLGSRTPASRYRRKATGFSCFQTGPATAMSATTCPPGSLHGTCALLQVHGSLDSWRICVLLQVLPGAEAPPSF